MPRISASRRDDGSMAPGGRRRSSTAWAIAPRSWTCSVRSGRRDRITSCRHRMSSAATRPSRTLDRWLHMIVFLRLTQSGLIDSGHLDSSRAHLAPQVAPIWTYRDIQNIRQIVAIAIQPGDAGPSFQTRPQVIDPAERNGIRRLPMTQTLNGTAGNDTLTGT